MRKNKNATSSTDQPAKKKSKLFAALSANTDNPSGAVAETFSSELNRWLVSPHIYVS
jgi:hypothetical protein